MALQVSVGKVLPSRRSPAAGSTRPCQAPRRLLKPLNVAAVSPTSDVAVKNSAIQMWNGNKRLQTQTLPVAEDTVSIRSLDWDRDRFDIEFGLENGTTYNSYLIFGDKVALVDASHEKFHDLYLEALEEQMKAAGRDKIDYIFVSHTEPDHSFLIPHVLERYPDAVVVGSKVCINFLKGLSHSAFKEQIVKGGDKVDLGQGHVVEFVMAPNLHWPDTMFSFDHKTNIMYTCDAFGMHYCSEDPYDSDVRAILPHYRFYYDCLMRPNAKSVTTALRKVKDLDYQIVANGHGPILRFNVEELVDHYKSWSLDINKTGTTVAVIYSSDYGFSDRLSQTLAKGITKAGVATEMVDMLSVDPQELVAVVGRSKGVVLMAPPDDNKDAKQALAAMFSAIKPNTKVVLAESFGGHDEPVETLLSSLLDVGCELTGDPLKLTDLPTQSVYQAFEEVGTDLAQALTAKEAMAKKKAAMPADVAKALGRISSGIYVVAAQHNNARSAMVASWVAQASFEPLGLTVAIAKDRAIESLMQVGDEFVLNCLAETNYNDIMKHFLKKFGAGADRFQGVDWFPANNGSPVLKAANAYLECRVVSRLETPDHWITYCHVIDGGVMQPDVRTAVHRRKVANYY